ncbi:glutamyl-tRNA reductase [Diaminobutyricimonas aerilata]|uniref:Glutamyl-tRNA reductase n=1 Tax=Diaminobutyricimonas aerilata TaxID=1162967 RepID=A0A2M9CF80_9MICO|nr:glutamyl-tRNA reductase [Diaminobutyricimonas aerilata]PJJ70539.1 glutamyl-tRNA reductase [Diaminobutyricimonas aerilata]
MLLCLTANHRNAGFDLLDRLSVAAPEATAHLVNGSDTVDGAVVLATCNRFEAYLDIDGPDDVLPAVERTVTAMSDASGVDPEELRDAITVLRGEDVAHHLFAVGSGLESVVVGEEEIAGQMRRAFDRARTDGTTSSALERLFQHAARTSREVRTATDIGGKGRSLVRLALELASSRVTDWSAARVLVVGTGQYAATTIAALRDRGVSDVRVYSATGRAARFSARYGVRAERELSAAIGDADVVITCTARYTITVDDVPDESRRLVIDLGLPRNVDPAVATLPNVELLDLEVIALHAPLAEFRATDDARTLVQNAASAYAADQEVTPAIVALRKHVFDALDAEIARARAKGADETTVESLRHLAGVLLHTPSVRARELAREGRAEEFTAGLEALFGVVPEPREVESDRRDGTASA